LIENRFSETKNLQKTIFTNVVPLIHLVDRHQRRRSIQHAQPAHQILRPAAHPLLPRRRLIRSHAPPIRVGEELGRLVPVRPRRLAPRLLHQQILVLGRVEERDLRTPGAGRGSRGRGEADGFQGLEEGGCGLELLDAVGGEGGGWVGEGEAVAEGDEGREGGWVHGAKQRVDVVAVG